MSGGGGALDAGSCAHVAVDSAEILGFLGDGVHEGQKCDPHCEGVWGRRRNYVGQNFWARGYWVSTVGKNEGAVRRYIQAQEKEDRRMEQLEMTAL